MRPLCQTSQKAVFQIQAFLIILADKEKLLCVYKFALLVPLSGYFEAEVKKSAKNPLEEELNEAFETFHTFYRSWNITT